MRPRPLMLAILVACVTTFVIAITLGAGPVEFWTLEILAWIVPRWIHDEVVRRLTEALTVVLMAAPGLIFGILVYAKPAGLRYPPGGCQECGYDVMGNMGETWPKCGATGQ